MQQQASLPASTTTQPTKAQMIHQKMSLAVNDMRVMRDSSKQRGQDLYPKESTAIFRFEALLGELQRAISQSPACDAKDYVDQFKEIANSLKLIEKPSWNIFANKVGTSDYYAALVKCYQSLDAVLSQETAQVAVQPDQSFNDRLVALERRLDSSETKTEQLERSLQQVSTIMQPYIFNMGTIKEGDKEELMRLLNIKPQQQSLTFTGGDAVTAAASSSSGPSTTSIARFAADSPVLSSPRTWTPIPEKYKSRYNKSTYGEDKQHWTEDMHREYDKYKLETMSSDRLSVAIYICLDSYKSLLQAEQNADAESVKQMLFALTDNYSDIWNDLLHKVKSVVENGRSTQNIQGILKELSNIEQYSPELPRRERGVVVGLLKTLYSSGHLFPKDEQRKREGVVAPATRVLRL